MRDYEGLVEALREHSKKNSDCELCPYTDAEDRGYTTCSEELTSNAADAIEELLEKMEDMIGTLKFPEEKRCVITKN